VSRPWDWSPLDLAADPVPGDPTDIRSSATAARATGTSIETQSRRLRRLATAEGWDSESGRTFTTAAEPLADAIDKAKQRYLDLASALDTYADGLEDLQRQADAARLDADDAQEARRTADKFVVPGETDPFEIDRQEAARTRAVDLADTDLADAKAVITRLVGTGGDADGEYGALNDRAVAAIRLAGDDELRDTWWDGVKQVVHDARGVLGAIKDVLNALGPLLAILAIIFPAAALGLLIAGIVMAALTLAITLAQASAGDASLSDVMADLAGVGLACIGFGGARAMAGLVAGTRTSVISSQSMRNAQRAAAQAPARKVDAVYDRVRKQSEAALTQRASSIGSDLGTRIVDGLVGGGAREMQLLRRLAENGGGPLAQASWRPGVIVGVGTGVPSLVVDVKSGVESALDVGALVTDSYWTQKMQIRVGSL